MSRKAMTPSETPRTDAIKRELVNEYPRLDNNPQKLAYYMDAAERFGQECAELERSLAAAQAENERLRKRLKEAERDARDAARDAAAEQSWKERQGDEYGSY